ncbi:MAG: SAM-dependent methyltransferase [Burkholderiales bacterium]
MTTLDKKMSDVMTADDQVARVFAWRRGFNAIHLIDLGLELGLFRTLAESPGSTASEIAGKLSLHAPYVGIWCTTAYGFGLLEAEAPDRFRLAPFFDQILALPAHPRYLGGYVRLGTEFAAADFRRCRDAFKTGEVAPFQGRSHAFASVIGDALGGLHVVTARKLLPELDGLKQALESGAQVLEVGCGTARFLLQLVKAWPKAKATGVDIDPTGIGIARNAVNQAGCGERVRIVEGDVASAVERNSCDVAVIIEALHEIAPRLRQHVINACFNALKPGGWLLIVDETYPSTLEETRRPEFQFPLQTGFEELLWGNVIPTREEQERLLRDAGFSGAIGRALIGEGFSVLSARR